MKAVRLLVAMTVLVVAGCWPVWTAMAEIPVFRPGDDPVIREWVVIGPFPNPTSEHRLPDGSMRTGFGHDFLQRLGGEPGAVLAPDASVSFVHEDGDEGTIVAKQATAGADGIVDLAAAFDNAELAVAYAYAQIETAEAMTMQAFFGSDDWAKVWVNGDEVHSIWANDLGRACQPRQESFPVSLRPGTNHILLKIDQNTGPWGYIVELFSEEEAERIAAEQAWRESIGAFQDATLRPRNQWEFVFAPGEFPELVWERPEVVEDFLGHADFTVRWFDGDLNEVTEAEKPGRYAAYVEAEGPHGMVVRRALTFYCRDTDWHPWRLPPLDASIEWPHNTSIDPKVWEEHAETVSAFVSRAFIDAVFEGESGAIFMAGMTELDELGRRPTQLETPAMLHQDYHLALKQKILGLEKPNPGLQPPRQRETPAPVLVDGTPEEAGMAADVAERLREVCQTWWDESELPFTAFVARNGVVVFHEAFGSMGAKPVTLETRFPTASITKAHAGLLFAQFMEQGLIQPDDPIGRWLPDFPVEGEKVITPRHGFTHTTGLDGHGRWNGMNNPWLDNVIANGIEGLSPGEVVLYNGVSLDLAGKVMEMAGGKSIFRLFHEHFFMPLGQDNPTIMNLGFGIDCTAADLGRVGQLMLNKGSYGDLEFFSPEVFEQLLPRPIGEFYPALSDSDWEYGMGISWMRQPHPEAGQDGISEDATLLSKNTIGHGAASSAVLRVDLDNGLVVTMARYSAGPDYDKHLTQFLRVIDESVR